MTIDLSQFVDKEVLIILRNGEEFVTTIKKFVRDTQYQYYFTDFNNLPISYTSSGIHGVSDEFHNLDIIKIKLRNTEPMTKLSDKTVHNLATALVPDAINYIHESEEYAEFMMEMITEFLQEKMGKMDDELSAAISFCLMDQIHLVKW